MELFQEVLGKPGLTVSVGCAAVNAPRSQLRCESVTARVAPGQLDREGNSLTSWPEDAGRREWYTGQCSVGW